MYTKRTDGRIAGVPIARGHSTDPLAASTVSATTYEEIKSRILEGVYAPGFRLREEDVAKQLAVSRTPVREALRRLSAEGFVDLHPNRGAEVAKFEAHEIDEIFSLRVLHEGYGARMAASTEPGPDVDLLRNLADQMEGIGTQGSERPLSRAWQDVARLNNDFHMEILASAGSERLSAVLSSLVHFPLVHRTFRQYTPAGLARSFAHHREIIAAIEARDPLWAEAIMRAHIFQGRAAVLGAQAARPQEADSDAG